MFFFIFQSEKTCVKVRNNVHYFKGGECWFAHRGMHDGKSGEFV